MEQSKRFEEWDNTPPENIFKCENCEHWWNNTCDSVEIPSERSRMACKSFSAIRSVVIPQQIKELQRWVFMLYMIFGLFALAVIGFVVNVLM